MEGWFSAYVIAAQTCFGHRSEPQEPFIRDLLLGMEVDKGNGRQYGQVNS